MSEYSDLDLETAFLNASAAGSTQDAALIAQEWMLRRTNETSRIMFSDQGLEIATKDAAANGDTQAAMVFAKEWQRRRTEDAMINALSDQGLEKALGDADKAGNRRVATVLAKEWRHRNTEKAMRKSLADATRVPQETSVTFAHPDVFLISIGMVAVAAWKLSPFIKKSLAKEGVYSTMMHLFFLFAGILTLVWAMKMPPFVGLLIGLFVGFGCVFFTEKTASARWTSIPNFVMLLCSALLSLVSAAKLLPRSPYDSLQDYYEDRR